MTKMKFGKGPHLGSLPATKLFHQLPIGIQFSGIQVDRVPDTIRKLLRNELTHTLAFKHVSNTNQYRRGQMTSQWNDTENDTDIYIYTILGKLRNPSAKSLLRPLAFDCQCCHGSQSWSFAMSESCPCPQSVCNLHGVVVGNNSVVVAKTQTEFPRLWHFVVQDHPLKSWWNDKWLLHKKTH